MVPLRPESEMRFCGLRAAANLLRRLLAETTRGAGAPPVRMESL